VKLSAANVAPQSRSAGRAQRNRRTPIPHFSDSLFKQRSLLGVLGRVAPMSAIRSHAASCPASCRASTPSRHRNKQDVDGRNKSGHDAARQSGHDVGCVARRPIPQFPDSLFKQRRFVGHASSSVFFAAPGTPSSSLTPRHTRGMARQVAQPLFFVAALPLESTGASRRAITAFSLRHRAALFAGRFHFLGTAMRQPAPGRRLLLATGRSPGAARVRALRKARARAPHPAPPSRRL